MSYVPLLTDCLHLNIAGQDKEINKNGTPKNDNKNYVKSKTRRTYLRDKRAPKPPNSGNYLIQFDVVKK